MRSLMYLSMVINPLVLLLLPTTALAAVSTQIVTATPTVPTNPPSYTSDSDFQSSILNSTNLYRSQHNATTLTYNASLATFAANYAANCQFKHSGGPDGENLAEGYATVTDAVDAWGNERAQYNFNSPGFSEATGHFTQLVWKATKTVGCGRIFCNGKNNVPGWYLVCEYYPPGNVIGEFQTEVQKATNGFQQCVQGGMCSGAGSEFREHRNWVVPFVGLVLMLL